MLEEILIQLLILSFLGNVVFAIISLILILVITIKVINKNHTSATQ